ncbi:MAG: non-canonical purine NTP pyrophosphatase [Patescibacteria group bacterium]|nr:non-canonical purine NTP pyrophosphatase [Patescibacteria group bacterium]MDD5164715.1 non-canonical purine NTP pyrophosphatase [Patescibacteria group bacterium]MDD5534191.1 non-canonical purine NTP pyrophosphatase [Patescibacteria group bacterium]
MKFYIGTSNPYKVRELASILRPLEIDLDVTDSIEPEEMANTFDGNAEIKAREYARHVCKTLVENLKKKKKISDRRAKDFLLLSDVLTISEDSGLIIPILGGLPGPWSARFSDFSDVNISEGILSGYKASGILRNEIDLLNNKKVLELMKNIKQPYRSAKFVVSLKVADLNGDIIFSSYGEAHGWITDQSIGKNGFGYDPIFISDTSFGKTWAEIDSMRKNLISHRRKALQDFTMWLATQIKKITNSNIIIVVDGNDGTGKTTLVNQLKNRGYIVKDRGIPTKLTDDENILPAENEFYIILDASVEVCRKRLEKAGRVLDEKYHTVGDLKYYREKFIKVAKKLKGRAVIVDSSGSEDDLCNSVIKRINEYIYNKSL